MLPMKKSLKKRETPKVEKRMIEEFFSRKSPTLEVRRIPKQLHASVYIKRSRV
jgi:tryptophan synthase beta subunit